MTYEELMQANTCIQLMDIDGKGYANVAQRINAFRSIYPDGAIVTDMLSDKDGKCVFKATIISDTHEILATGHAYEREDSSDINRTSYIENCETSAVGRALAMCGFGLKDNVASYEEAIRAKVKDAVENAPKQATDDEFSDFVNKKG